MRNLILLGLVSMFLVACGDDDMPTADAPIGPTFDAPVGPTFDAPVTLADAPPVAPPDAPVATADANLTGPDAGAGVTIPEACDRACTKLAECFMMPPDPSCNMECAADLADCTPDQVAAVYDCGGGTCANIEACLTAITCIMM